MHSRSRAIQERQQLTADLGPDLTAGSCQARLADHAHKALKDAWDAIKRLCYNTSIRTRTADLRKQPR